MTVAQVMPTRTVYRDPVYTARRKHTFHADLNCVQLRDPTIRLTTHERKVAERLIGAKPCSWCGGRR